VVATGSDRVASPVTGARKALTSGTRLLGRERDRERERESGVRDDGWGRPVSGERRGAREGDGSRGLGGRGAREGVGPETAQPRGKVFPFSFLFSISYFYFIFLLSPFLLNK
jgi:hypothetical protein